jgi:hypothetical protein
VRKLLKAIHYSSCHLKSCGGALYKPKDITLIIYISTLATTEASMLFKMLIFSLILIQLIAFRATNAATCDTVTKLGGTWSTGQVNI